MKKAFPPPPPQWRPYFSTDQIFAYTFRKGSHKEQSCEIIPNSDQRFRRRRIFSCPYSARSLHPPPPPPPPVVMFFDGSKILRTIFEKGCPKNIHVKLFQNRTRGFRGGEFWRISLKSTQWKKSPPMAAMFLDGSNIREQFSKRVTQGTILWNYSKFWPAVSEKKNFEEFLWSPHIEKKASPPPPPMAAMFFNGSKFREQFLKKDHLRNNLVKLFQNLTSCFRGE